MLLHELFERQAAARSGSPALLCGDARLTYGDLEVRANRLARLLRQRGVGRGACVALWLPRSMDLYAGLLGILKAGAAYVPIDAACPAERANFMLSDCEASALVTTRSLAEQAASFGGDVVILDDPETQSRLSSLPSDCLTVAETGVQPEDVCYVIYTSGTTGKPKGVQIEHRSACHLVETEGAIFQVRPEDRVYQGFSIAFDASVEEVWLAFFSGAALVVCTPEMERAGAGLSRLLTEVGVTVLSCVPTLLAMTEEDVPSVRLLILGGEACPPGLIERWWRPDRRVFNTYGPTEATVIATCGECHPQKPVTIGKPVPGYFVAILDEHLQPAAPGVPGELCIGGIGLARGYIGRPELTREKFVPNPLARHREEAPRLYRTGDLASWTPEGELRFLGRIDTQVKIRGFRVELAEIESVLLQCPGVQAAAVTLREDAPGLAQLVGYVVPRGAGALDEEGIRASMRSFLPSYMVPALLETLTELPTLPSGKVDRKQLPAPRARPAKTIDELVPARTVLQREIAATWEKLFAPRPVSMRDDFFLDLGGHSLLAARMVSELRRQPALAQLSMLDVYRHPTIEALAAKFEADSDDAVGVSAEQGAPTGSQPGTAASSSLSSPKGGARPAGSTSVVPFECRGEEVKGFRPRPRSRPRLPSPRSGGERESAAIPFWRHFLCGSAQLVSLIFILSFFAVQWLAPYLTYTVMIEVGYDYLPAILGAFASLVVLYPLMLLAPIAAKWILIGRYRPGNYPLWGTFYYRWWLLSMIEAAVPIGYLAGTPLMNIYLRLMGARVGRGVHLDADTFVIYDLLSIGDGSSLNVDANLLGYTVEDGWLKLGQISIGKNCFVGARAVLRQDTTMEDDSALEDLSLLPRGATIPSGETWRGSPASKCEEDRDFDDERGARPSRSQFRAFRPEHFGVPEMHTISQSFPAARRKDRPSRPCSPNAPDDSSGPSRQRLFGYGLLYALSLLFLPSLISAALFPGIVLMNQLNYIDPYYWYLLLAPLVGLSFVVLLCLEIAAMKWLLIGRAKPGRYPLHGFFYLRKWFVDKMMDLSLDVLGPLYASIYLAPWYRLLGARLGQGAEVSTASFISPDLLSIGDESFIADSVSLGAPRVRDGILTLGPNHIGKRSFIGNSALLPPGTVIGDNVLIGCLSVPPANPADALREDTAWLGSPAILLPQRQKSAGFSDEATYHPSPKLRIQRAVIEFVRVITPSTCFIILISLMFSALLLIHDSLPMLETLLFFPFLYIGCGVAATLFTILAKWILIWRYRPGEKPLWSTFVWRNELLNALHEHLAEPFFVGALTGTPFVCWYFRLLGARIGRRVYMETTDFSEFDLASIGDEAALNADCTIQTHLFEDRVMKMSRIDIAPRCTVGAGSLVLYDTRMEAGSSLGELSLLMKSEVLPAGTSWEGVPARSTGRAG